MWKWLGAFVWSVSPELRIILRHGVGAIGALTVEGVLYGVLRISIVGSQFRGIVGQVLMWTAVSIVTIFCVTTVAIAALNAFEEIRSRYRQIKRGEDGEVYD